MASLDDLKTVLKETLEQKGVLNEIKAKIRAEIFTALDADAVGKPKLSNENLIINEMIREYLEHNKYYNTLSVLLTETGQPAEAPFDR
jgi:lisH domain-containing protein FOPNL